MIEEEAKGIGAIAALGFEVKKSEAKDSRDGFDYLEHVDGTRVRVAFSSYQATYHFSLEAPGLTVVPWEKCKKLMEATPKPNKVHKPSVRTVQAWLDYCAAERKILTAYFEQRTKEREAELASAFDLGAVDVGYYEPGKRFSAESENKLFRIEWDFSNFSWTKVRLSDHFYSGDAVTIYKALGAVPVEGLEE